MRAHFPCRRVAVVLRGAGATDSGSVLEGRARASTARRFVPSRWGVCGSQVGLGIRRRGAGAEGGETLEARKKEGLSRLLKYTWARIGGVSRRYRGRLPEPEREGEEGSQGTRRWARVATGKLGTGTGTWDWYQVSWYRTARAEPRAPSERASRRNLGGALRVWEAPV